MSLIGLTMRGKYRRSLGFRKWTYLRSRKKKKANFKVANSRIPSNYKGKEGEESCWRDPSITHHPNKGLSLISLVSEKELFSNFWHKKIICNSILHFQCILKFKRKEKKPFNCFYYKSVHHLWIHVSVCMASGK